MFNSERNIFLRETEIKPNRNATLVLIFLFFGVIFCWLLNELGLFRVGKWEMRIGSTIPLIFVIVMLVTLFFRRSLYERPYTKYFIFAVCFLFTFIVNTLLTFHTTLMLLFPIFLAMLYRSKTLGICGVIGSVVCTVFTPILSYFIHVWDIPLLQELILIGTNSEAIIANPTDVITLESTLKIILYLVLPRLIMVGSCALLMFHVINLNVENVNNQVLLDRINSRDALTGLYNQNYFKNIVEADKPNEQVGIVFFDVNGLKAANDANGHEYGDLLLQRSAQSLLSICDDKVINGFRIGGDEFLLLIENADEKLVLQKIEEWKQALDVINEHNKEHFNNLFCSLAYGYVVGKFADINELVHTADAMMYKNKAEMKNQA